MNVSDQNLRCFLLEKCFQRLLPHLHQIHFIVYLTIVMNQPTKQQDKPISNFHQFLCLSFANCVRFSFFKEFKMLQGSNSTSLPDKHFSFSMPFIQIFCLKVWKTFFTYTLYSLFKRRGGAVAWILFGYSFQERLCNALHLNM